MKIFLNCVVTVGYCLIFTGISLCKDIDSDDGRLNRRRPTQNNRNMFEQMQQAISRHEEIKRKRLASCTSLETSSPTQIHTTHAAVSRSKRSISVNINRVPNPDQIFNYDNNQYNNRHRLDHPYADFFGLNDHHKSVYFNGSEVPLKYSRLENVAPDNALNTRIPSSNFTVDIWVKPEGGQYNHVQIFALRDSCSVREGVPGFYWAIGIETQNSNLEDQKASFSFNIRSHRAYRPAKIIDSRPYIPNVWIHLAATYDGSVTKLYINGAKVGKTERTWGELFIQDTIPCLQLILGGNLKSQSYFRGEIGYLSILGTTLSHHEIVKNMLRTRRHDEELLSDNFDSLDQWEAVLEHPPRHMPSTFLSDWLLHDVGLSIPHCGQTVCDDPEVTLAYLNNPKLRTYKIIRARIINLAYDDGSSPLLQRDQIKRQSEVIRKAFKPHNISISLEEVIVKDSVLRRKKILFGCEAGKIGDEFCDSECDHQLTGNDGGDCGTAFQECDEVKKGNGDCDMECNNFLNSWDGGDCCLVNAAQELTCFDPNSPNRIYMSLNEYKEALGLDNTKHLNIYFADWTMDGLVGLATFPWEHEVHTKIGGVVIKPQQFGLPGSMHNLVHEIGHILGLWHTHHGISEMDCTDACLEIEPSLEHGDLCADTNPTNENRLCSDPEVEMFTCAINKIKRTHFKNYMGYGGDGCTDYFSPQQAARMHCYLDLIHKPWLEDEKPAPVALAPRILTTTSNSVTLAWIAPLNHGANDQELCNQCQEDLSLLQYASHSFSPGTADNTGYYSAMHASGPPDSAQCEADPNAWVASCSDSCYIEVFFHEPTVAKKIYIWVNWNPIHNIDDIILFDKEGQSVHLGPITAFCDMPFTMEIYEDIKIRKIQLVTYENSFLSIDAVAIQSHPDHSKCHSCHQVLYKVKREPPFDNEGDSISIDRKYFKDVNVERYTEYKYTISTIRVSENGQVLESLPSPVLTHVHGGSYCGDGKVSDVESCDDGNLRDGDGCSLNCKIENFFHCTGAPSLCYKHDGDGICEPFEERASVADCGFFTPRGYTDQWAVEVQTDSRAYSELDCPISIIIGPPPVIRECKPEINSSASWHPCISSFYDRGGYWIKTYFETAVVAVGVVIYLGSDGMTQMSMEMNSISVSLIDEFDQVHDGGKTEVVVICRNNPIHVNLKQDLTMAFFYTKGILIRFRNPNIAVAAVSLRSYKYLDPKGLQTCKQSGKLYNTKTGSCSEHPCAIPECDPYKIKHGIEYCSGFTEGDVCEVTCNKGYRLNSYKNEVMCLNGLWEEDVVCEPIKCDPPQIPYAKVKCDGGYAHGSKCKFECKSPAIKRGRDTVIECQWDGTWSLSTAYCEMMCHKPVIKGGRMLTESCNSSALLPVGTKCKARCLEGYKPVEMDPQRSIYKLTCTDEGTWEGTYCERVECEPFDNIYHGLYSCSNAFYYNSQCTLKCPEPMGAVSSITCLQSGEWNGQLSSCNFPVGNCPEITPLTQYSVQCNGSQTGSRCSVLCNSLENEEAPIVTVFMQGTTSEITADSILCTGNLLWYPDPLEIHCIRV